MRSITLSESVLGAYSLPSPFPKPLKPSSSSCYLLPFKLRSKKLTSKLSLPNPSFVSSRYSCKWNANTCEEWFRRLLQTSGNLDDLELHYLNYEKCRVTTDPIDIEDDCVALDKALPKKNFKKNCHMDREIMAHNSFSHFWKAILLFGFLALQGSEPAFAISDLASGLPSIPFLGDLGDLSTGFASAFLLIFFSELGDKTFFIAALLAARNSAPVVFIGTFGALAAMTIISVVLGRTFHYIDEILPFRFGETDLPIDDIAAVLLLVYFGVSTLLDATSSDSLKAEDEQREAELAVSKFSGNGAGILAAASTVISTFLLVFVAEWGDKSFFSTIALAAASSPLGVIGGALAGHGVATLLAVLGGSLLGTFLSEKAIAYTGGVLFLVFAAVTFYEIVT
ncbi:protein PAM71, chloroplastic [Prunus avium]|uniref:GDT1 family protein n=1 Tax=Prunus avium TaxID=42229 RepID=A0A6P5SUJ0_PRUAV|nr:protein PAM71, chloroplastic [Prunus avium]XP_021820510.1 protein PAM71, chloroplastic [Prunus avium]XP_021820511.1 protein PAM71, chloroplastic [Prunus avium]